MRSGESREGAPGMLRLAAGVLAAEAAGLCVAIVFNVIDSTSGRTWTTSNAIAFIVLEVIVAIGVAWIATGISRVRPWSRTPAVMTQLLTGLIAIWLLQAGRFPWGVPALLLALAGLAGLLAPASFRALTRPIGTAAAPEAPAAPAAPAAKGTKGAKAAKAARRSLSGQAHRDRAKTVNRRS